MKISVTLFGLLGLIIVGIIACLIFCNIDRSVDGYDLLIYSKKEQPIKFVGIRYKEDFMLHVFNRKTVGDGVDKLIDWWRTRDEKNVEDNK